MNIPSTPLVSQVSTATPGSVNAAASMLMLRKALELNAATAIQVLDAVPQPAPATSGTLGTRINTYA